MAGYPHMYETMYGAGYGYDVGDASTYGGPMAGPPHTHFIISLIIISVAAVAILGGLRAGGFHFVVKT